MTFFLFINLFRELVALSEHRSEALPVRFVVLNRALVGILARGRCLLRLFLLFQPGLGDLPPQRRRKVHNAGARSHLGKFFHILFLFNLLHGDAEVFLLNDDVGLLLHRSALVGRSLFLWTRTHCAA